MAEAEVIALYPDSGTYTTGGVVTTDVTFENTGSTDHTYFVGYTVHGPDGGVYDNDGTTGTAVTLSAGEQRTVRVGWEVESAAPTGSYDVQVSVWEESDPDNLHTRLADQWVYDAFSVEEETVDARITELSPASGTYESGEGVTSELRIENTGNAEHTFYAGYSVWGPNENSYDNSGTTGQAVQLAPGESRSLSVTWNVEEDAPEGSYDIQVAAWKESGPDNLHTRLDERWEYDTFYVQDETVRAAINSITPGSGTYESGATVETRAEVENTGTTDHTFFVGYTVHGPDGNQYDNNDTTGRRVSLNEGEQTTIDLQWDVEDDAPEGAYDVQVAVWKESDRDNLHTRLDEQWAYDAFYVQEETARASLRSIEPDSGTYDTGAVVETRAEVENTGTTDHTFFVGYTVHGPDGNQYDNGDTTGQRLSLSEGERTTVTLQWEVESDLPDGSFDVQVAVWKEDDRDNLQTRLDEQWAYDAFYVQQTTIDATLRLDEFASEPYTPGESVTTRMTVENTGTDDHTFYVTYSLSGPDGQVYDGGDTTGGAVTIEKGEERQLSTDWIVPEDAPSGGYDVSVAVWKESDPDTLSTRLDQRRRTDAFTVDSDGPDITATLSEFEVTTREYVAGEEVTGTVRIENTSEVEHTFFVGFTAFGPNGDEYDNDDQTGQHVTLFADEATTVEVTWTVPPRAPAGQYAAEVAVWKESDRDNLQTRLASDRQERAFSVVEFEADARIGSLETEPGPYTEGQIVPSTLTLTNTGETEHTFYITHAAVGPDDREYDNGGTTGREVSIPAGEQATVDLEWQVTRSAPIGTYGVRAAVWAEPNLDASSEPLDTVDLSRVFEVRETLAAASIASINIGDGPFAGGESVPIEVEARNTGETEHTFFVEYQIYDTDSQTITEGTRGLQLQLEAGTADTVATEWRVPTDLDSGRYDVQVIIWSERDRQNLEHELAERRQADAFTIDNPQVSITDLTTRPSDGSIQSLESVGTAVLTLENTGDVTSDVTVRHWILGPNSKEIVSDTQQQRVGAGQSRQMTFQWAPSRAQGIDRGSYDYAVSLSSTSGEELLSRTYDDVFSLDVAALGQTDYSLELLEAAGEEVGEAYIDLEAVRTGERFSQQLRNGSVEFEEIPAGLYEITVEHGDAYLEESFRTVVAQELPGNTYVLPALETLSGTVIDSTGEQQVPEATVSLDNVDSATTDGLGTFSFDQRVPDGEYRLRTEDPNGATMEQSVTLGAGRHVDIQTDEPLISESDRGQTPDSEVIGEENQLVTVLARYLQNTDDEDIVINHYTDQVHGAVKGIIASFEDLIGGLKETVTTILSMGLDRLLDAIRTFLTALWETKGGIILQMAGAILAAIPDMLEEIHNHQQEDNPYEIPNPQAYSFMSGWYLGYVGVNLILGWAVRAVTLSARGIVMSSDALTDALDKGASAIRRLGDDESSMTSGDLKMFSRAREHSENSAGPSSPDRPDIAMFSMASVIEKAPDSELARKALTAAYEINYRYRARVNTDDGSFVDPFEGERGKTSYSDGAYTNIGGNLAEPVIAKMFLEGADRFPDVDRILPRFDSELVSLDERVLVLDWDIDRDDFDPQFDLLEVEMRQPETGDAPVPVVTRIWESSTDTTFNDKGITDWSDVADGEKGKSLEATRVQKREQLRDVLQRTARSDKKTPESRGLSGDAMAREGEPQINMIDRRELLETDGVPMEDLAEYFLDEMDMIDFLFNPSNND